MDNSDQFTQIIEEYIDDHERLKTTDAFQSKDDEMSALLAEVWRIVQSRKATESDEAVADIRSTIFNHILTRAESLANHVMLQRSMHGDGRAM